MKSQLRWKRASFVSESARSAVLCNDDLNESVIALWSDCQQISEAWAGARVTVRSRLLLAVTCMLVMPACLVSRPGRSFFTWTGILASASAVCLINFSSWPHALLMLLEHAAAHLHEAHRRAAPQVTYK